MMQMSLIPDEYTADPATAFELGRRWGIDRFEIRYAYRWRLPYGPAWTADVAAGAIKDYGVTITGISPGLFKPIMEIDGSKSPLTTEDHEEIDHHCNAYLDEAFAFAEQVGTRNITIFALSRGQAEPDAEAPAIVVETLGAVARRAGRAGFVLLVENCAGSWADHAAATVKLLDAVDSKHLRLTWDPANAARALMDVNCVTEGYPLVRKYVANVHVKDMTAGKSGPAWAMMGTGVIDWARQIEMLHADGYTGPLTIEPHLQYEPAEKMNLVEKMEVFLPRMRELLD